MSAEEDVLEKNMIEMAEWYLERASLNVESIAEKLKTCDIGEIINGVQIYKVLNHNIEKAQDYAFQIKKFNSKRGDEIRDKASSIDTKGIDVVVVGLLKCECKPKEERGKEPSRTYELE